MVITSLSANFGCGPRSRNGFPFVTPGTISSIRQKHVIIKSSRLMKFLLRCVLYIALRIFHESFLWQANLHIALTIALDRFPHPQPLFDAQGFGAATGINCSGC